MIKPLCIASALSLALSAQIFAQSATDQTEGEQAEGDQTETETQEEAAPPPPDYNGSIRGTTAGSSLSAEVVCEGFGSGGSVTIKSDPGGAPGEDLNGDGVIVDISASDNGSISLNVTNGNNVYALSDTSAEVGDTSLSYEITMSFSGGATETIQLNASCQ